MLFLFPFSLSLSLHRFLCFTYWRSSRPRFFLLMLLFLCNHQSWSTFKRQKCQLFWWGNFIHFAQTQKRKRKKTIFHLLKVISNRKQPLNICLARTNQKMSWKTTKKETSTGCNENVVGFECGEYRKKSINFFFVCLVKMINNDMRHSCETKHNLNCRIETWAMKSNKIKSDGNTEPLTTTQKKNSKKNLKMHIC